jgi:hypothetical protein
MKKLILFLTVLPAIAFGQLHHPGYEVKFGAKRGLVALAASPVDSVGFTAKWKLLAGGSSYTLDVSTDPAFGSFVGAYHNFSVSGTSQAVTGLSWLTAYYYRLKATKGGKSYTSNTISLTTIVASGYKYFLTNSSQYFKGSDSKFETVK